MKQADTLEARETMKFASRANRLFVLCMGVCKIPMLRTNHSYISEKMPVYTCLPIPSLHPVISSTDCGQRLSFAGYRRRTIFRRHLELGASVSIGHRHYPLVLTASKCYVHALGYVVLHAQSEIGIPAILYLLYWLRRAHADQCHKPWAFILPKRPHSERESVQGARQRVRFVPWLDRFATGVPHTFTVFQYYFSAART